MIENKEQYLDVIHNGNLVGVEPSQLMLYGPTKLLTDAFHYHSPQKGIVSSYTPKARDVEDHYGVFRGVDQIEAFAQATIVACATFLECRKQNCTPDGLCDKFVPAFIGVGNVSFQNYLEEGDTFISIGNITFWKWRQMVCDGRIYRVPKGLDLDDYFSDFTEERLLKYDISTDFIKVAELHEITGRAILIEMFNKLK